MGDIHRISGYFRHVINKYWAFTSSFLSIDWSFDSLFSLCHPFFSLFMENMSVTFYLMIDALANKIFPFSEVEVRSERKTTVVTEIRESYLLLIQNMADFTNAISWLPPGLILWSGKLSRFQNGFFGLISSSIMLYRAWPQKEKTS